MPFIEVTEDKLKTRVETLEAAAITDGKIEVELLPENETAFRRPTTKGRISICFFKNVFGKTKSTDSVVQDVNNHFEVFVMATKKRGEFGVYDLYNRVIHALIGFQPSCTTGDVKFSYKKFVALKLEFWLRESNLWIYRFEISGETMMIESEVATPVTEWGNLTEMTFQPPVDNPAASEFTVTSNTDEED